MPIEQLRAKLIDLSLRNKLLTLRLARGASISVVDELPEQIFDALKDGKTFTFDPLPDVDAAGLEDFYATNGASEGTSQRTRPDEIAWARHHKIPTSLDLAEPSTVPALPHHADRKIRTLLYRDTLETRVRKLTAEARSAIDETGSNMLFVGFGFLEWREERVGSASEPGKVHLAPLVLLPVQLVRDARRNGPSAYEMSWNGEDVQDNLALRQKLRVDFDLKLPDFDTDAGLTKYFRDVAKALATRKEWRIRRQVYLTLIPQLGKLLLYNDLDPANWYGGEGIQAHELVGKLLGGMDGGGAGISYQEGEEVDPETIEQELSLPVVDRCDSSQLEAVRLALSGASFIIQGPPGTGKSQTITNIIAAVLASGKSVLFVAEKLAAIDVVKRRLDGMELGEYCLELHSNRTRKNSFLQTIEQRLKRHRPGSSTGLAQKLQMLMERRDALRRYVDVIRKNVGPETTVSDVLYAAGRSQLSLGEHAGRLIESGMPSRTAEALKNGGPSSSDFLSRLADFGNRIEDVRGRGLRFDIWRGVRGVHLLPDDLPDARSKLLRWETSLSALKTSASAAYGAGGSSVAPTLSGAALLARSKDAFQDIARLTPVCRDADNALVEFLGAYNITGISGRRALILDYTARTQLKAAPLVELPLRHSGLFLPGILSIISNFEKEIAALRTLRNEIDATLPGARNGGQVLADVQVAAATLRSTGMLGRLFGREWKSAIGVAKAMSANTRKNKPAVIAAQLEAFVDLSERCQRLFDDHRFGVVAGPWNRELDTPIAELAQVARWIEATRSALAELGQDGVKLGEALLALPPDAIASQGDTPDRFGKLREEIAQYGERWPVGESLTDEMAAAVVPGPLHKVAISVIRADRVPEFVSACQGLAEPVEQCSDAERDFAQFVDLDINAGDFADDLAARHARLTSMIEGLPAILDWVAYARARADVAVPAVEPLIVEAEENRLPPTLLPAAWVFVRDRAMARSVFQSEPALNRASGAQLGADRQAFRRLDEEVMELRRADLAQRLHKKQVPPGTRGQRVGDLSERALLEHQIGLIKRHRPIRELMRRAGRAVQALKPCFMMGPMSVAQYLAPGYLEFDLVIMDEASQLRPEDAIGAVARGKQVIIVGDDMQLPPTSFFERIDGGDDTDEDDIILGQREESVLRLGSQCFKSRMLSWHYRSQNEALIAFSNYKFYDSRLIVFPTPRQDPERTGIEFNYIAGGRFLQGVNDVEARAVAEAAVAHIKSHPTRSAIVVAMNIRQRDRIRAFVEELSKGEAFLIEEEDAGLRIEPFEVKNLENVQGDERDVVFISLTYGPDPGSGRVLQRFGPINGEYGHRRLNVLFSRARQKMVVFSSMRHGDIVLGENSALGVQALRDFLFYAETKKLRLDAAPVGSGRAPDSDFEIAVAEALTARGYECVAQLGVAGFFLDLAIRNPDDPSNFLLGIECDGAAYHSTRSARDRDRLRQDVLESLGWQIERVWSTDWFTEPAAEVRRIVAAVERAREAARVPRDVRRETSPTSELAKQDSKPAVRDGLSREEARAALIQLRDGEIYVDAANADRTRGLLRQSMIDALLRLTPTTLDEFQQRMPLSLREKTDSEQIARYSDRVFEILERVTD